MIKDKFNQAKCKGCGGWHFAILLDDKYNPIEFKCCRCRRIITKENILHLNKEQQN